MASRGRRSAKAGDGPREWERIALVALLDRLGGRLHVTRGEYLEALARRGYQPGDTFEGFVVAIDGESLELTLPRKGTIG